MTGGKVKFPKQRVFVEGNYIAVFQMSVPKRIRGQTGNFIVGILDPESFGSSILLRLLPAIKFNKFLISNPGTGKINIGGRDRNS